MAGPRALAPERLRERKLHALGRRGRRRFDASWADPTVSRWLYPVLVPSDPGASLAGAKAIEFEVKTAQDKVENDFRNQNVMLVRGEKLRGSNPGDLYHAFPAPVENWERRSVTLPDGAAAGASALRIGVNPLGSRCTLWIRNVGALR